MGVERLQLFVRFCNVCGLIPFRMVCDERNQFKRFDRHWRHPANWWFTFLLTKYFVLVILFMYNGSLKNREEVNQVLTKVEITALMLYLITNNSLLSIPRLVLIHLRHWETAIECLHRIDRILNKMPHHTSCTTRQRTMFGFCVMIVMV
jgi:hypothetical protein